MPKSLSDAGRLYKKTLKNVGSYLLLDCKRPPLSVEE